MRTQISPKSARVWTRDQLRCIARFMSFMARYDTGGNRDYLGEDYYCGYWIEAFESGWKAVLDS